MVLLFGPNPALGPAALPRLGIHLLLWPAPTIGPAVGGASWVCSSFFCWVFFLGGLERHGVLKVFLGIINFYFWGWRSWILVLTGRTIGPRDFCNWFFSAILQGIASWRIGTASWGIETWIPEIDKLQTCWDVKDQTDEAIFLVDVWRAPRFSVFFFSGSQNDFFILPGARWASA